jgi:glycerophosphoryl diester phosphodiesterase
MDAYPVLNHLKTPSLLHGRKGSRTSPSCVHVSHRGGSWIGPANSMLTYRKAVHTFKTQVLEIDLHLSADGQVVLMHDPCVFFRFYCDEVQLYLDILV